MESKLPKLTIGSKAVVIVLIVLGTCACTSIASARTPEQKESFVRALCEAYRSNRESFRHVKCKYVVRRGVAKSRDAAIAGKITPLTSAVCEWVVDGNKERCTQRADDEAVGRELRQAVKGIPDDLSVADVGISSFTSNDFLSNGDIQMSASRLMNGGTMYASSLGNQHENSITTPWGLRIGYYGHSPSTMIDEHLNEGRAYLIGSRDAEPQDLIVIELHQFFGKSQTMQYVFDPARGYLPVEIKRESERGVTMAKITDVWPATGGRWFPKRIVQFPLRCADCRVLELKVVALDVENRPKPEDFEIEFPEGAFLNERSHPWTEFTLKQARAIGPDDLPKLVDRAMAKWDERKGEKEREELAKAASSGGGESRWWLAGLSVIALLSVATIVVWKRRRPAAPSASDE